MRICSLVEVLCREYTAFLAIIIALWRKTMSRPLLCFVPKGGFMMTVSNLSLQSSPMLLISALMISILSISKSKII